MHFFPKHPTGPCSTCPSWSCNVVYCVVSVNENKLYLFDSTRLDRSLSLSRGTWNPLWWTGEEAGIHLLYCQVQERARGFLTLHLPHSRTTFSWWHSEQLSFWYLCWKLIYWHTEILFSDILLTFYTSFLLITKLRIDLKFWLFLPLRGGHQDL